MGVQWGGEGMIYIILNLDVLSMALDLLDTQCQNGEAQRANPRVGSMRKRQDAVMRSCLLGECPGLWQKAQACEGGSCVIETSR